MTTAKEFRHAGATLVVERHGGGEADGGPLLVLIHGIGMGRGAYSDLVAHLDDDAAVVAVDLPGYGDAPEPERVLTMARTADLIAAYLRAHADPPAIVVGHSMGTQVTVELAARHPDLVAAIVLVGPTVDPRARSAPRQIGRLLRDLVVESPTVLLAGAREFLRAGPHLRRKLHAMLAHRPEDVLPRITAPALVLRGEHDAVVPLAWCLQVVALLPDARFAQIDGHGHETMIRDAAAAATRIQTFAREVTRS